MKIQEVIDAVKAYSNVETRGRKIDDTTPRYKVLF